jgi:pimeloyl-[acyl-carrier protein] methyl ester esterase
MLTRLNDVAMVDVTTEANSIGVPTLYLRASVDRVVPSSAGDAIQRNIPHATITELAGPHLLLQACPHEAAKRIADFALACVPANNSLERTRGR